MINVLILAHGTEGDVRQSARIGRALKNRGHEVTVITHCTYEAQLESEGMKYAFIDTPEEYEQLLLETRHNLSLSELLAHFQRRFLPKLSIEYQLMRERHRPGETVLVTHANTYLAARILSEMLRLPVVTAFTAPGFLAQVPIIETVLGKALGPAVNQIRADFGLRPVGDWSAWWRQDSHPLALWPEWFAPPEPDWPADLVQAGFLITDPPVAGALPAEAEAFLAGGEPPVLLTGGTGLFVESNYYEACIEACARLGRRVVLVARHQTFVPRVLPESVAFFSALPFASLMPRVAAVIHHGGLATISQALAAGCPQVILARGVDRPDNAQRVERLGVGQYVPPVRWQADPIAEALDALMNGVGVKERCREIARRIHEHDSLIPVADLVEAVARDGWKPASPNNETPASVNAAGPMPQPFDVPVPPVATSAARGAQDKPSAPAQKLAHLSQRRLELAARLLRQKNEKLSQEQSIPHVSRAADLAVVKATTDLSAEAVLDPGLHIEALPPATAGEPANIFLTGATGFLGAFLLHELLQQTPANIYCLVRASGLDEGRQRLRKTLTTYGLWNERVSARIIPVPGNLSEPLLGVAEAAFTSLAGTLDVIYHNGAQVSFVYPYATLKAANVLGTQEVLRLACRTKVKPVHYVSTLLVVPPAQTEPVAAGDPDTPAPGAGLQTGYAQSKWVAERLVMLAGSRGLPVSIYRPGRITGHSQTGVCNTDDLLWRMIKGCIQLGSVPDLKNMMVDITPVDYVSRAIVYLSRRAEVLGQVVPLLNPCPVPWQALAAGVASLGYTLRQISYEAWRTELLQATGHSDENALASLLPIFSERAAQEPLALKDETPTQANPPPLQVQQALELLKDASILCPPANSDLLNTYFAYCRNCGFLSV